MMVAVDFPARARMHERPGGLIIALAVKGAIKPVTMVVPGVIFFEFVFAPCIEPATSGEFVAGLILVGAAPCGLTGTSNHFELAVAAAIGAFGLASVAALAPAREGPRSGSRAP